MEDRAVTRSEVESLLARVESLEGNYVQLVNDRVRPMEDRFDTLNSPRWKRMLFRLDGWAPWYVLAKEPAWRPWRRWYRS